MRLARLSTLFTVSIRGGHLRELLVLPMFFSLFGSCTVYNRHAKPFTGQSVQLGCGSSSHPLMSRNHLFIN